jgi:hypothetical protein
MVISKTTIQLTQIMFDVSDGGGGCGLKHNFAGNKAYPCRSKCHFAYGAVTK